MITEETDRLIDRRERQPKTFEKPIYIWLGTAGVILGIYYFGYQFRPSRVEEWLPIGIVAASGAYILIANRVGWNIPGSKFRFWQHEYVFEAEKDELHFLFSSSTQKTKLEKVINLKGVESFSYDVDTSSTTQKETRLATSADPTFNPILTRTASTGTFTQTRNRTYTTRKTTLILEPEGREILWGNPPENLAGFVERLNKKLQEVRKSKN